MERQAQIIGGVILVASDFIGQAEVSNSQYLLDPTSLFPNGKLALAFQTKNCMVVLGSMLSLTCHLDLMQVWVICTIWQQLLDLPPNGKLALAGQTRNCMVMLGSMLSLTHHLDDLCYSIKVTDTKISHNCMSWLYSQTLKEDCSTMNLPSIMLMYVHKACWFWIRYKNGGGRWRQF